MPEHWVTDDGYVRLCVAKGTLVPAKTLRCGHVQASKALCLSLTPPSLLSQFLTPSHPHHPSLPFLSAGGHASIRIHPPHARSPSNPALPTFQISRPQPPPDHTTFSSTYTRLAPSGASPT